jgi:Txe/YoeB family toxin of Txe-Axe toxin-antitoxin module
VTTKYVRDKEVVEGSYSAHVIQKNPQKFYKKFKQVIKQKNTTPFKNKKKDNCFTCRKPRHYTRECEEAK